MRTSRIVVLGAGRPGLFQAPSAALIAEKRLFGSSRRARWFGL